MEATVAERGQITLPKAVRDALGLTKGTTLKVELDGKTLLERPLIALAQGEEGGFFKRMSDGALLWWKGDAGPAVSTAAPKSP